VGTPSEEFHERLAGGLHAYGYRTEHIKLSQLLSDLAVEEGRPIPTAPEDERIDALMDEGDSVCGRARNAAAVALLGVGEIRARRADLNAVSGTAGDDPEALQSIAAERTAWVLDSLKRPAEVFRLRRIYGDHLVLVSLKADTAARRRALVDKVRPSRSTASPQKLEEIVGGLIRRDLDESDSNGQNTLKAYPAADLFVDVDGDVDGQVTRFLDLLFASPSYREPTACEYGMHLATVSSTRSAELGLKVGATLLLPDMGVVALGTNRHPRPTGSPAYDASAVDIRALLVDTLRHMADDLSPYAKSRLADDPETFAAKALAGVLKSSQFSGLTEFQPTVHAEMDALLQAARDGHHLTGATVYVTAYPCHNCAKHLVALGLNVYYLEPYPKSRAAAMYGDAVQATFQPFVGVAPRRYQQLFGTDPDAPDRKLPDGRRKPWGPAQKTVAQPRVDPFVDQPGIADREGAAASV
jgi:deoxycytidylate deaminase